MKKNILLTLLIFLFFKSVVPSLSAKDFGRFAMDVPSGWSVDQDENLFRFIHPENHCIFNVLVGDLQESPSRELIISFYQGLNGKNAQNIDGGVSFDMITKDNIPGRVRFSANSQIFTVVSAIGHCYPYQNFFSSLVIYGNHEKEDRYALEDIQRPYPLLPVINKK